MALTPEDVQSRRFKTSFRGYDEEEVDSFLDEVEVELTRLHGESDALRQRLDAALAAPPPQPVTSEAEEMLRRTLLLAQRTADETVAAAQAEAEKLVSEANARATSTLQQAEQQAATSIADLERRRQALEQHIEGLRAFEREYRTRLKAYLEAQLRDLDGRTQGAPAAGAPAAGPGAVPGGSPGGPSGGQAAPAARAATPPAAPPVAPTPVTPPTAPPTSPPTSPPAAPPPAQRDPYGGGEPEPFDIDEGGGGVPRLAP
jgi:DivIVA domain-containing protein